MNKQRRNIKAFFSIFKMVILLILLTSFLTGCEKKDSVVVEVVDRDKEYLSFDINGETLNKWVVLYHYEEYDNNGNLIYEKTYDKFQEKWREKRYSYDYDSQGNATAKYFEDGGKEWECKFDSYSNMIYKQDFGEGSEIWNEYDSKGHLVYCKEVRRSTNNPSNNYILENWYSYDEQGNCIHNRSEKNRIEDKSLVLDYFSESESAYDENGRILQTNYISGNHAGFAYYYYEYNEHGDEILCSEVVDGYVTYQKQHEFEYNDNLIVDHEITSLWDSDNNSYKTYTYNYEMNSDRQILHAWNDNQDIYYGYDTNGEGSYYKSSGAEQWYSYTYWDNQKIKTKRVYTEPSDKIK